MSASSSPTRRPCAASATARFTAVVDLPTPPLPEATATIFATSGSSIGPCPAGAGAPMRAAGRGATRRRRSAPAPSPPARRRCAVSTAVALSTPGTPAAARSAACRSGSSSRARSRGTARANCTSPSRAVRPWTMPASTTSRPVPGSRTARSARADGFDQFLAHRLKNPLDPINIAANRGSAPRAGYPWPGRACHMAGRSRRIHPCPGAAGPIRAAGSAERRRPAQEPWR